MPILLWPGISSLAVTLTINFVDQTGENPVPGGQLVYIYPSGVIQIPANATAQGYTQVGGTFTCTLFAGSNYFAVFASNEAPQGPVPFSTPSQSGTITVDPTAYASPTPSQQGFTDAQIALWPKDWFSDDARSSGGNAYAIAWGIAAVLEQICTEQQDVFVALRIDSSTGPAVDSWVADFFGAILPRNSGETDAQYIKRAKATLAARLGQRAGFITIGSIYGPTFVNEPWRPVETGALDIGTFAWDVAGGWQSPTPEIDVYVKPSTTLTMQQQQQMKALLTIGKPAGIVLNVYVLDNSNNATLL